MRLTNSAANDGQRPTGMRIPRPATQAKALAPAAKRSAPPPLPRASKIPEPPPAPRRPLSKRSKASPPPLPELVLLTDADLIDDDLLTTQAMRDAQPTSVDVELDCFSCTEPPPKSRPRRRRAVFACVTSLLLVAVSGVLFLARPLALNAQRLVNAAGTDAARTPALLTVAAFSTPVAASVPQESPPPSANPTRLAAAPSIAASHGPRSQPSAHARRANPAGHKKSTKPARAARALQ